MNTIIELIICGDIFISKTKSETKGKKKHYMLIGTTNTKKIRELFRIIVLHLFEFFLTCNAKTDLKFIFKIAFSGYLKLLVVKELLVVAAWNYWSYGGWQELDSSVNISHVRSNIWFNQNRWIRCKRS